MTLRHDLERDGFAVVPRVLPDTALPALRHVFEHALRNRPGSRDGLGQQAVRELARCAEVRSLVEPLLGAGAFAYRATLFDKTHAANWLVAWHQDLVVPVHERVEAAGYGAWSQKGGRWYVQPRVEVLEGIVAVRIDLDGSDAANGALRVLPGTHRHGVLAPGRIAELAADVAPVTCPVPAGGALLMHPLLLHASSRAREPLHRRVVHIEFTATGLPGGPQFHDAIGKQP